MGWKVALAAACLALVASGIAIRALRVARADQDARAARLEADNRRWKNRAGELERETAAIRRGSPVPAGEPRQEVERGENAARINTLGDRVEDVFLVSGEALANPKTVLQLEQDLLKELSLTPQPAAPVPETALH